MARGPGSRIGRYLIDRRLGSGGMADAFLAHQEGPAGFSKQVVLKILHEQHMRDPSMVELFLREARVGARLNHQNIVQIFDLGDAHSEPYIAMEYVDGMTLLQATRRRWALGQGVPIDVAVRVVAAAAQGLHFAHTLRAPDGSDAGVVHRDISPDNIVIGRDGAVKVLDFGVAKLRGGEQTKSGELKGKIPYMAPEQLDTEQQVDARADLWALGVTLYWCLAGRRPFVATNDILTIRAILETDAPRVRALNPHVSAELDDVVMSLLEKDVNKRIGSAAKLAQRLLRVVPATQQDPVARFMERLAHYDDEAPEAKLAPTTPGIPATPPEQDTSIIMRAALPALSETTASEPALPEPHTVRTPHASTAESTRKPPLRLLAAAAIASVVAVGVVAALVLSRDAPTVALVVDSGVQPVAPATDAGAKDDGVQDTDDVDAGAAPTRPTEARPDRPKRAAAQRAVVLAAPAHVRWLTPTGKVLCVGSRTIQLADTETTIVAHDTKRDAKTTVPVQARIDYATLPKGRLNVRVLPYASDVKLGGESLGPTPLKPVQVVAGTYRVVVVSPKSTVTRSVKVKANDETLLTVDLRTTK